VKQVTIGTTEAVEMLSTDQDFELVCDHCGRIEMRRELGEWFMVDSSGYNIDPATPDPRLG